MGATQMKLWHRYRSKYFQRSEEHSNCCLTAKGAIETACRKHCSRQTQFSQPISSSPRSFSLVLARCSHGSRFHLVGRSQQVTHAIAPSWNLSKFCSPNGVQVCLQLTQRSAERHRPLPQAGPATLQVNQQVHWFLIHRATEIHGFVQGWS